MSKTEERSDLGVFSISDQLPFRKCQYWGLCYFFHLLLVFVATLSWSRSSVNTGSQQPRVAPEPALRAHLDPEWPGRSLSGGLRRLTATALSGGLPGLCLRGGHLCIANFPQPRFPPRRLTFCRKYSLLAADKAGNANLSHLTSG